MGGMPGRLKTTVPAGWVHQAYAYTLDCPPARARRLASHVGAARFAYNWMLAEIERRLHDSGVLRTLALRQGATASEADGWARERVELHWDPIWMLRVWNESKDEVAPWWAYNSKEVYATAAANLAAAFQNYFAWRDGERAGPRVGWPQRKHKGRDDPAAGFTAGGAHGLHIRGRHQVQLPKLGRLRTLEPTDQLRLKLQAGTARLVNAALSQRAGRWQVSFNVVCLRDPHPPARGGPCGTDVGIRRLATSSDGQVTENPRARDQAQRKISRYHRQIDRQHRAGSPQCFGPDGQHIQGHCYWDQRSRRSRDTQRKLQRTAGHAANVQLDAQHKASYRLATQHRVNVIEDLNVAGMSRHGPGKRGFNRALAQANLAGLRRLLGYKHQWYLGVLLLASQWYPSSKTCSRCHQVNRQLKRSDTTFRCPYPGCGLVLDRDVNAARNLEMLAQLAALAVLCQMSTGIPVDWSRMPVRPWGWQAPRPTPHTRSSRGSARAGHPEHPPGVEGGDVRHRNRTQPRAGRGPARSFDREDRTLPLGSR